MVTFWMKFCELNVLYVFMHPNTVYYTIIASYTFAITSKNKENDNDVLIKLQNIILLQFTHEALIIGY